MTEAGDLKIVAHRGASADAPENTLAAFRLAIEQGAHALEGDFRLTKDKQVVCIHDETTKRVAGKKLQVNSSTLKELRQLDVGLWKGKKWQGEKIPTLEEVLALLQKERQLFLEIKCGPEIMPPLKQVFQQTGINPRQIVILAFSKEVVKQCREQLPDCQCNWVVSFKQNRFTRRWSPSRSAVLKGLKETDATGLSCKAIPQVVNQKFIDLISAAGKGLHVWTVNNVKTARYFQSLGASSITTDHPLTIISSLQNKP